MPCCGSGEELLGKLGGDVGPIPKTLNLIYEQNLWLLSPYLSPGQKFDTLFMTIAAGTVTLKMTCEGLLWMVLLIMMKK